MQSNKVVERNVITLACEKKIYFEMAINLARSFFLWHNKNQVIFHIVTDLDFPLPDDLFFRVKIIKIKKNEFGKGFSPKIHLDKVLPNGETLFIDSDCLIYGNLHEVFDMFIGHDVSVVGDYIKEGDWFGAIEKILPQFNLKAIPKFNGGLYFIKKGALATKIYQDAREIENKYDEIGFLRLRNRPNDEVIMALSMQLNNQKPIHEDGSIMAEFFNFQSGIKSNLLVGKVMLYNLPSHKNFQPLWPLMQANPKIVHYLGHHTQIHPYITEVKILSLLAKGYRKLTAQIITFLGITVPYQLNFKLREMFRPAYRSIFGTRRVKKSERIID